MALVAFVARVTVVLWALAEPVWDGFYYDLGARRIASGLGYSEDLVIAAADGGERVAWLPWAHYPVGYSGFLAAFYKVFGESLLVAPLVNAVTGALLAAVAHRIALHAFADEALVQERATIAGFLVALHPGLVLYAGAWMTEPLAALLMLSAILFARDERRARGIPLSGLALGLATLVRPNAVLMAPFVALAIPGFSGSLPRRFFAWTARSAVVMVLALATVAPWTLRNCRVMDACALVSTNAGWNLVIGAAPGATGKFEFLVGHTPEGGPACDEGGQVAQDRCWWKYGVQLIRRDVRRWAALIPAKLHYTMDAEWFPINYLREARPDRISAAMHVAVGKTLTALHHLLVVVAALAAIGVYRPSRGQRFAYVPQLVALVLVVLLATRTVDASHPSVWAVGVAACLLPFLPFTGAPRVNATLLAVAAVVLTTLITHAVFFGEDRYHLVATPALCILAAGLGRRSR